MGSLELLWREREKESHSVLIRFLIDKQKIYSEVDICFDTACDTPHVKKMGIYL